jgi:hypothetical protein
MLAQAEHAAATERLRLLEKIVARHAAETRAVEKKKVAAAAAAEAGEPVAKKPRGVWVAWVYGEPSPSDGGDPIPSAAARFPEEHAAFVATLASKRGADINFASEASTAAEGDPVGIPKPVAEEGESDEDYAARVEEWRATDGASLWSVDAHEVYAEHVARYKAIVEARSADGSSSKSRRVKLTEEEKLANREARKAATKAKNEALKAAKDAEKAKAKAAKPAAKAKAAPAVVKNAAKPPPKASAPRAASKAVVVNLAAAEDDSDSSSDEEEEEERAAPPPPPAAKAAAAAAAGAKKPGPPAPKAPAAAGAKKPGPPAPKAKAAPPALSLKEEEEAPAAAVAAAEEVVAEEESGRV